MDEGVKGNHRIEGCRFVFPRDHVRLLEGRSGYELPGALDLHGGNVQPEHIEVLVSQQLSRGKAGATSKIEDSRARRYELRQVIDPSLVVVRTFVGSGGGRTFIVAVCARDRIVATANKIAPARTQVSIQICRHTLTRGRRTVARERRDDLGPDLLRCRAL